MAIKLMVKILQAQEERVETGIVQFGEDWPGTFIRGDNAFAYKLALDAALKKLESITNKNKVEDFILLGQLENLRSLLEECQIK